MRILDLSTESAKVRLCPVRDFQHITDEEVHQAALKSTKAFGGRAAEPQMMAENDLPFTDKLVGREFALRYDNGGPVRPIGKITPGFLKCFAY
jgi:hypothetical protein